MTDHSSRKYINEVKAIVSPRELWVAYKTKQDLVEFEYAGNTGYAFASGEVFTLQDFTWNDLLGTAWLDPETMRHRTMPLYPTLEMTDVKFGLFEDVYKKGYTIRPAGAYRGFDNKPIVVIKG